MLDETTDIPLLEARGVAKRYAHVEALRGADLDVREGEIVGLIGDNGAGKSTLLKILCGVARMDEGEILLRGHRVDLGSPAAARDNGIEAVFQDLALAGDLNPVYNFYLGREIVRGGLLGKLGFLDKKAMAVQAQAVFDRYGLKLAQPSAPVATLSGGQKQSVAVIRSVAADSALVFMDEPTAALGVDQTRRVVDLIQRVNAEGTAVVLISHDLPHVLEVAHRIHVLRLGRRVATFSREEATLEALVDSMMGVTT